ncbi:MAG: hypothetical protein LBN34_02205 [Clostridiales Family XIII bacterium]|jgi:predicted HicB family RNase H-like nuclease|nr:hypothetical protein [Clostridiales Family XIII bacterium]
MKFNIKKQEYANRTFRLPIELIHNLEKTAQRENVSINNLVVQCCNFALDNLEIESPTKK